MGSSSGKAKSASKVKRPAEPKAKKTRSQLGRMSKNKGAEGEREFAALCRSHGFLEAVRTAQHCGKNGGQADVKGLPGYHIEVKRCEAGNVYKWMEQAIRDVREAGSSDPGKAGAVPIVAHRRNGKDWLVIMRAEDWLKMLGGGSSPMIDNGRFHGQSGSSRQRNSDQHSELGPGEEQLSLLDVGG